MSGTRLLVFVNHYISMDSLPSLDCQSAILLTVRVRRERKKYKGVPIHPLAGLLSNVYVFPRVVSRLSIYRAAESVVQLAPVGGSEPAESAEQSSVYDMLDAGR